MRAILTDYHFAWKSVVLALVTKLIWVFTLVLCLRGALGISLALFIMCICAYINFTPMHEASHGNIAGRFKKYRLLEKFIGHLSASSLFIPFPIFKQLHLQHHSFTNVKEWDPDFWVATRNPFILIFKVLTIKPHYYFHALIKPRSAVRRERKKIISILGFYLFIIILSELLFGVGLKFSFLWFSSAVLALAILAFVFDWLPHTPHNKIGRYIDTAIIDKSFLTYPMLYQNYHLSHHLYPRVPFYHYKKVYHLLKDEMIENGARIL